MYLEVRSSQILVMKASARLTIVQIGRPWQGRLDLTCSMGCMALTMDVCKARKGTTRCEPASQDFDRYEAAETGFAFELGLPDGLYCQRRSFDKVCPEYMICAMVALPAMRYDRINKMMNQDVAGNRCFVG